jgi:hypothetical protein
VYLNYRPNIGRSRRLLTGSPRAATDPEEFGVRLDHAQEVAKTIALRDRRGTRRVGGESQLWIPVSGPKGEATLYARAGRGSGPWVFTALDLRQEDRVVDLLKMARPLTPTELRPHRRPYLIALGTPGVVTPTASQDYYDAWLGLKVETLNLVSVHDAEGRLLLGVEYALERVSRIRIADGSEWKFSFVFADDRPNDAIEILITAPPPVRGVLRPHLTAVGRAETFETRLSVKESSLSEQSPANGIAVTPRNGCSRLNGCSPGRPRRRSAVDAVSEIWWARPTGSSRNPPSRNFFTIRCAPGGHHLG